MEIKNNKNPQLVLFSGGRDSTLVAATLMQNEIPVHLFTANSGCSILGEARDIRVNELRNKFGQLLLSYVVKNIYGAFREIALLPLENDILKYKKNLILLGEKLAIHVHATEFCLKNNITILNDGVTNYQNKFPEQREIARGFFTKFSAKYSIEYRSPIYHTASNEDYVKTNLLRLGLSPKSMEGVSMFANTNSNAYNEVILEYLESKEAIADEIIQLLTKKQNYGNY